MNFGVRRETPRCGRPLWLSLAVAITAKQSAVLRGALSIDPPREIECRLTLILQDDQNAGVSRNRERHCYQGHNTLKEWMYQGWPSRFIEVISKIRTTLKPKFPMKELLSYLLVHRGNNSSDEWFINDLDFLSKLYNSQVKKANGSEPSGKFVVCFVGYQPSFDRIWTQVYWHFYHFYVSNIILMSERLNVPHTKLIMGHCFYGERLEIVANGKWLNGRSCWRSV